MPKTIFSLIFNTDLGFHSHIKILMPKVRDSGYKMFIWNGTVYRLPESTLENDFLSQPLFELSEING